MLKDFYRNTIVFNDVDVAEKFISQSLISERLSVETSIENGIVTLVYATWTLLTEDERLDILFYPNIVEKSFNVPYTDYGKKRVEN